MSDAGRDAVEAFGKQSRFIEQAVFVRIIQRENFLTAHGQILHIDHTVFVEILHALSGGDLRREVLENPCFLFRHRRQSHIHLVEKVGLQETDILFHLPHGFRHENLAAIIHTHAHQPPWKFF